MSEEIKNDSKVEVETAEKTEEVVVTSTKKQTWLNRVWSAVVGAAVAVGAMFGITQPQIDAQKAKVVEIKTYASEALEALRNGDVKTATTKLQEATAVTKEVAEQIKKDVNKIKEANKESVVETAKTAITETLVKDQVKKAETTNTQYAVEPKVEVKKTEVKKTEVNTKTQSTVTTPKK